MEIRERETSEQLAGRDASALSLRTRFYALDIKDLPELSSINPDPRVFCEQGCPFR